MKYTAFVSREDGSFVVLFPDCPGCQTQADRPRDIGRMAAEALEGWLESMLEAGDVPARPRERRRAPRGARLLRVEVPARLAVKLLLRWARVDAGLTQADLARRTGVSQQQIAKLEHPDSNPTIETLDKVARVLGRRLDVDLPAADQEE